MNGLPHALVILIVFTSAFQGCGVLAIEGDTSKGKRLYEENCLVCHGQGGKGDGYRVLNPPPADLLKTIHAGKPNTAMGAWR